MVHVQVIAGDDVKSSIGKLMFMYMKMIEEGTKALYVYINPFDKGIDEDCDRFIARIKAFNDKMTEQVENIIERISKALESQESVTVIAYCNRNTFVDKSSNDKRHIELLIEQEAWDDKPNNFNINPIAFNNDLGLSVSFIVDDSFDRTKTGLMEMEIKELEITKVLVHHPMFQPLLHKNRLEMIDKAIQRWMALPIARTADMIMRLRAQYMENGKKERKITRVTAFALRCVIDMEVEGKGICNSSISFFNAYSI